MLRTAHNGARTGSRPMFFARFSLLFALVAGASACGGDPGEPGPAGVAGTRGETGADGTNGKDGTNGTDGKDGASATVDPSLSALQKALVAIGGQDAITKLNSFSYKAKGSRFIDGEGYLPGDPANQVNTFNATVRYDVAGNKLRIDTERTLSVLGMTIPQTFSEIIAGDLGYIEGSENIFGLPGGDMPSARWASIRKQQRLLNPHILLRGVAGDPTLAEDGGLALHDGSLHHLLVVKDEIHPITLYVSASTGRIAKASTLENDYLHRDREVEAHYVGWEPSAGGVLFPKQVAITFGEQVVHNEVREPVEVNGALDAKAFEFPAGAMPVYQAEDAHRGEQNHQYHQVWASFGIPQDVLQTVVTPTEIAPGVYHLTGGTHHSMVVEQENGIVLVDAPLYQQRSEAILAWIKGKFPGKPVSHMIISHHHQDHSAGARSILPEGAKVVVGEATAEFFRGIFGAPSTILPDALALKPTKAVIEAVPAGDKVTIPDANAPVTAYHLHTTHSADMLMVHAEKQGVLFVVDIYSPGNGDPGPAAAKELNDAITIDYGINVSLIAGGHGGTSTFAEFQAYVP